ncbi:MAG: SGNH/GDSL hydrolase family protein, partial [Bacteroidetes bacterium]|nr:SGNH/GDSL hydrolase family protein [Bacteroidota bacterium]
MRRKVLIGLTPVAGCLLYACIIHYMMAPGRYIAPSLFIAAQWLATIILIGTMLSIVHALYQLVIRSAIPEVIKNILLSTSVIAICLLGTECALLHYARSRVIGEQWCYKLWDKTYVPTRTPFDYTDSHGEPASASLREPPRRKHKKAIWFIGDSFTFGFGLEQTSQTIPAVVEHALHDQYDCINLGDGGADTYKERENLLAYAHSTHDTADAVVWQYFGNDIDINDEGPDLYEQQVSSRPIAHWGQQYLRGRSFLLDYIYWNRVIAHDASWMDTYYAFLEQAYRSDSLYRAHLVPIIESMHFCRSAHRRFMVVIFPFLWVDGPTRSAPLYTQRLAAD